VEEPGVSDREALSGGAAANAAKTQCVHGHPLSGENLYRNPWTGARSCRACARARHLRRHEKIMANVINLGGGRRENRLEMLAPTGTEK
jgi:hypothetical protein